MTDLVKFYKDLLDLSGVEIGDFGRLYVQSGIEDIYLKIDDKFVIFPDKDHLNSPDNPKGSITFHPLSESVIRGLSEVQNLLRRCAILHLNYVGGELLTKAIEINSRITHDTSYKPTHKISKLFASIDGLDEKFIRFWNKLNKKMTEDPKCRLFDIFMTRHGDHASGKYDRFTAVISPLYDQLVASEGNEVFGVKAERKKDITTLISILDALFPDIDGGGYTAGSSSPTAPYLDSYITALLKIENRFNDVIVALGKELDAKSAIHCRGLDIRLNPALTKLRTMLPPDKEYNVGVHLDDEKKLDEEPHERKSARRQDISDVETREEPRRSKPEVAPAKRPKVDADAFNIDGRSQRAEEDRPKLVREEKPRPRRDDYDDYDDDYDDRRRPARRPVRREEERPSRDPEEPKNFWERGLDREERRGSSRRDDYYDDYDDRRGGSRRSYRDTRRDDYDDRRGPRRRSGGSRRDEYDRNDRYGRSRYR